MVGGKWILADSRTLLGVTLQSHNPARHRTFSHYDPLEMPSSPDSWQLLLLSWLVRSSVLDRELLGVKMRLLGLVGLEEWAAFFVLFSFGSTAGVG